MKLKIFASLFLICLMFSGRGQLNAQDSNTCGALNRFSFNLYKEARVEKENFFLSPLSIYYALLPAYEGAADKTKKEFQKVLYLENSEALKNTRFKSLPDFGPEVKIANAIWFDKSIQPEEEYRKSVSVKYSSDFKKTDFANIQSSVSAINNWISEKTEQQINEIISADEITPDTKILISSAVHFKGEWRNKFEKQNTFSGRFFSGVENHYKIDFMKMTENLQYFENEEFQFISKPYEDSNLSFCIVLPKELFGIEDIEKKLDADLFSKILENSYSAKTSLSIPKIELELTCELSKALKSAGLKSAFTDEADFSGITKEKPLMFTHVLHKTRIALDEEKTEAAAATSAVTRITGISKYKIFKADHPFLFYIIDNSTNAIIFMGRFAKPVDGSKVEEGSESLADKLENRKQERFEVENENKVLFVVDEKIVPKDEFSRINPENIESVEVLKNKEAVRKYSSENYDGVVLVTLKKDRK